MSKDPSSITASPAVRFSNGKEYHTVDITRLEMKGPGKRKYLERAQSVTDYYEKKKKEVYDKEKDELLKAIVENKLDVCRNLLENEVDLKSKNDTYFFHPLLLAAQKGRSEILELLLDHGADINVKDNKCSSALHLAIQPMNSQCCLILLERGIKFKDSPDKCGNLAIHLAASEGLVDVVQWLLNHGQNPNVFNKKSQTPVHLAASKGQDDVLRILLNNEPIPGRCDLKDTALRYPLHYAAWNGHSACCDIILEKPDYKNSSLIDAFDREGNTALILAAKKGHSWCCESLQHANINRADEKGNTALHHASKGGFMKTVRVLLEANADCSVANKDGNSPIHMVAMQNHVDCLHYLISCYGKNPGTNKQKQGLLHIAAVNSCEDSLSYLLKIPLFLNEIDSQDNNGKTPLHLAINQSNVRCAEILLEAGAKDNIRDNKENIPLHVAAGKGLTNLCKLLLQGDRFKRINTKNKLGATPLHLAAMNGSSQCCSFLILKGSIIASKDFDGFTPYHVAAKEGKLEIIKFFTKKKGNLINEAVENSGDTPLHLAVKGGHYTCCEFFLNHIPKNSILMVNEKDNSALDESFYAGYDEIFRLILLKCPSPSKNKKNYEFEASLHLYMHEALTIMREIIVSAIVESAWWCSGFSSCFCKEGRCGNFLQLMQLNQDLAEEVFDRCAEQVDGKPTYDFRILEDLYYIPSVKNTSSHPLIVESPYDMKTGKLIQDQYKKFESWNDATRLPLKVALDGELRKLIQHPLVDGYWSYKWKTYLKWILYIMLVFEILIAVALSIYLSRVWNWDQINEKLSVHSFNCSDELNLMLDPTMTRQLWLLSCRLFLAILIIVLFIIEINSALKLKLNSFKSIAAFLRISRLIGIFIVIIPSTMCINHMWIIETWQWQIGIVALLLSWFHLIHSLNDIPKFSVFMPITLSFVKSFFKVLFYLVLILFIFALIFHLLFSSSQAFANIWISFIKSIVWMLGDLAYDDMFLDEKSKILYPIMSNIIFVVFVTSISGFIINLIITQPTNYLESFRNDAVFHKDSSRIQLMIKFDTVFSKLRMKYAVGFWVENLKSGDDISSFIEKKLYSYSDEKLPLVRTKVQSPPCPEDEAITAKQFETLIAKIEELKEHISSEKK